MTFELDDLKAQAIRYGARETLATRYYADYFKLVNPDYKLYKHIQYICDKVQKIIDGEQHNYIVEMPPQHGKSTTITKTFPSYYLMRHPDKHVMLVAYSEDLYSDFSASNRRIFEDWGGRLFGLHTEKSTSQEFTIADHRGGLYATSITGGATGKPADLLIIDDPVKNYLEASSKTKKDGIWNEWVSTFETRLQQSGSVILIMTRWQTDDLAGRLLAKNENEKNGKKWEEIKFPAIAEEDDILGRKVGDPLCPQLHNIDDLKNHKRSMGTQKFTAEYQQSPTIEGGGVFKRNWVRYYVPSREVQARLHLTDKDAVVIGKHFDDKAQSWDATFKSGENDDYVAGQVWYRRDANYYLMYWVHDRMSFTETLKAIQQTTTLYPDAYSKYIEDKANGSAIIDTLRNKVAGIIPITPDGGKEVRASAVTPLWEAGNVYVPHPLWKPEIEDMLEEIFAFPNAPHDDYVDAMTQALNYMQKNTVEIHNFF